MDLQKINDIYKTVPYHNKPDDISAEEWQIALRRQFAERHRLLIENIGNHPVFSNFNVSNHENGSSYKVAIRSGNYDDGNFCECMDFKTNGLGTCKHIESVLLRINENQSHKLILECAFQPNYTSMYLKYGKKREVKIRIGYEQEQAFTQLAAEYFDNQGTLLDKAYSHIDTFITKAADIHSSFRCYSDAMEYIIAIRDAQKRSTLVDNNASLQALVKAELYEYQQTGIQFIVKAGRCLLADDMGLGKTIQTIAATQLLKKNGNISTVLIVCPTSLKYQWQSEIRKFTDDSFLIIEGNATHRAQQYAECKATYIVVSYATVLTDFALLNQLKADVVVLDEAQRIKNFKSKIATRVKLLKSDYAVALTGTPLENKLEELYSIMQFVDSYKLGPFYEFISAHRIKDENGKLVGYKGLNDIANQLNDRLLRRTRKQVLNQLPERIVKNQLIAITPNQHAAHNACKRDVAAIIDKWKRHKSLGEIDRHRLISQLNCMRMVCDSTYLIDQQSRYETKISEVVSIVDEMLEQGSEKALIFSQWERTISLIATELDKRSVPYKMLTGSVPGKARGTMVDAFTEQSDCRIFLSTDTGSTGLNLQAASLIINVDIPWSPAIMEQRISRLHRLGQKQKVTVINLIAAGTIEQKILDVLAFKNALAKGVLDQGEDVVFMGESKFEAFMGNIETMITEPENVTNIEADVPEVEQTTPGEPLQLHLFEHDELSDTTTENEYNDFISSGISFFDSFAEILSNEQKRTEFLEQYSERNTTTNQLYLKIPIDNRVEQSKGTALLASFLQSIFQK